MLLVLIAYCTTVIIAWFRPNLGLGMACTFQVLGTTAPETFVDNNVEWGVTAALVVGMARLRPLRNRAIESGWMAAILGFGTYLLVGPMIVNQSTGSPFRNAIGTCVPLLWGYLFGHELRARRAWTLGLVVVSILNLVALFGPEGLLPHWTEPGVVEWRTHAFTYAHTTSMLAGFLLVSALAWLPRGRAAVIRWLTIAACVALLVVSFSRGALLGVSGAIVLYPVFRFFASRTAANNGLLAAIVAVLALVVWYSGWLGSAEAGAVVESYERGFSMDQSNAYRVDGVRMAFKTLEDRPLLGIGTTNFWDFGLPIPHQLPISYALSYGIPVGLIVLLLLFGSIASPLKRAGGLSRLERWRLLGIALVNVAVAMTNGAMALGVGIQWFAIGSCVRAAHEVSEGAGEKA